MCTGPSSVAQRVRGLRLGADDWITKPCHPEELICVIEAAVRRHRRSEMADLDGPASVGELTVRPDLHSGLRRRGQPRADRPASSRSSIPLSSVRSGPAPRGDLRAGVGLRDGPRRPLGRRVRAQAAPEAPAASPAWSYIHTHFGVGYRFAPQLDDGSDPEAAGAEPELADDLAPALARRRRGRRCRAAVRLNRPARAVSLRRVDPGSQLVHIRVTARVTLEALGEPSFQHRRHRSAIAGTRASRS